MRARGVARRGAGGFAVAEADGAARRPQVPPGVPSTVLARRPMSRSARARDGGGGAGARRVRGRTAGSGPVADRERRLRIEHLGDLLQNGGARWGLSRAAVAAALRRRRREANVQGAMARGTPLRRAPRAVLVAFREVEDQLGAGHARRRGRCADPGGRFGTPRDSALDSRYRNGYVKPAPSCSTHAQRARDPAPGATGARGPVPGRQSGLIRALGGGWSAAAPTAQADGAVAGYPVRAPLRLLRSPFRGRDKGRAVRHRASKPGRQSRNAKRIRTLLRAESGRTYAVPASTSIRSARWRCGAA